ncbi:MAG: SOS response-associated peptidase [Caulobacteraceae bacterium]
MCNDYGIDIPYRLFVEAFSELDPPLNFVGPAPNLEPRDEIWPTDRAPVIRAAPGGVEMIQLRWGLDPGRPKAPPVVNMRGEGREFPRGRCLVPASHFYEFTGAKSPKTRWRFTNAGDDWLCIAGVVGRGPAAGPPTEAFTMLTCPPGPDVAPIHNRQPVILERSDWAAWLTPERRAADFIRPSPHGSLQVSLAPRSL